MSIFGSFSFIRLLKSLHGWLGFFVLPWIIVIGLTGIYLNHSKLILGYLPAGNYNEAKFDDWPKTNLDEAAAKSIAVAVFPGDTLKKDKSTSYHGRDTVRFDGTDGQVIIALETGHYWVKTRYVRRTFDPDGRQLDTKLYWGSLFKRLHRTGWFDNTLGTWLADITAGAMVIFGLSGIILFLTPRLRRRKNRRAQVKVARTNVPRPQRIVLKE